ncbi:MAG: P-II family nitrogen regulator [Nevskia sp.]|nr:P-II family nitrogen regulator [Nevskia sp.]
MKQIAACLQPHRLSKVVRALHSLARFPGFTVLDAHGQGHGRGAGGHHAYDDDGLMYYERCVLTVVCEDGEAASIADLIARTAHTGNKGDGIVVITEVSQVLRIRDAGGGS